MSFDNVRNNRESLMEELAIEVEKSCAVRGRPTPKNLRQRIGIAANLFKWDEATIHFIIKKKFTEHTYNWVGYVVNLITPNKRKRTFIPGEQVKVAAHKKPPRMVEKDGKVVVVYD